MHRAILGVLTALVLVPSVASAQFATWRDGAQATVTVPLRSLARPGSVMPIEVEVRSVDPLEGRIKVVSGDGTPTVRAISVGRGSTHRVTLPLRFEDWAGDHTLTVRDDKGRWVRVDASALGVLDVFEKARRESEDGSTPSYIAPEPTELPFDNVGFSERALHVAVLGDDPLGWTLIREVDGEVRPGPVSGDPAPVEVVTLLPTEAPTAFYGWGSVDLIVWRRPDPSVLTAEQLDALLGWVAAGGRLVVSLDAGYAAFRGTALAEASGFEPVDAALQTRVGEIAARVHPGRVFQDGELLMVELKDRPRALWATAPVGGGHLTVVNFDVADEALRELDRSLFWRRLLTLPPTMAEYDVLVAKGVFPTLGDGLYAFGEILTEPWDPGGGGAAGAGWRGLLTEELEEFEGTSPISSGALMLFGILYLLVIGPIDWFVVRRLGRPALTWVTFPAAVLVFSGVAMLTVTSGRDGASELRCLEVVDTLPGLQMERGMVQCSLWNAARRDLRVGPGEGASGWVRFPPVDPDLYWDGPPATQGRVVRGGPRSVGMTFEATPWSLTRLQSEWTAPGPATPVVWDGERLRNGATAFTEAWLVRGSEIARIGPLAAGAVVSADTLAWEPMSPLDEGRWSGRLRDLALDAPAFEGGLRDPRSGAGSLVGWTAPAHPPRVEGHDALGLDIQTYRRIPLREEVP